MIYDCLFERSDSALNPFEMLYDYLIEMIFRKQTVFCTPAACSECLPIESWPNSIGKHPAEKIVCLSFRDAIWLSFWNERQRPQSFWNDIWLSFRNERRSSVFVSIWYMTVISIWRRKNFRTENHFRQRGYLKSSWRKCPLNPIFSYTDFFAVTVP